MGTIDDVAVVGEIRLLPTTYVPARWLPCQGQVVAIDQYEDLFKVVGTAFGGDGSTTFMLPDLRARSPLGAADGGAGFCMCAVSDWVVDGTPSDGPGILLVAELRSFAVRFAPSGWLPCQGQTLRIEAHVPLFSLLGTRFGGDGVATFALPDLRAHAPWPATVDAFVGLCVSTDGELPARTADPPRWPRPGPWNGEVSGLVGEVKLLVAPTMTSGWLPCEGQVLPLAEHAELYSVIGVAFGGDGVSTFALPDLGALAISAPGGGPPARYCIRDNGQYPNPPSS